MAGQKFTLTFDAQLNVGQMKGAIGQIQSTLNGLHLPQNISRGLQGTIDQLNKELQGFETSLGKNITNKGDFNKLNNQAQKIASTFEKLKLQIRDLGNLSTSDVEKLFPTSVTQNINKATNAIKQYESSVATASKNVDAAASKVDQLKAKINEVNSKNLLRPDEWSQLKTDISAAEDQVKQYAEALKEAQDKAAEVENKTTHVKQSSTWRKAQEDIKKYTSALTEAEAKLKELYTKKATSTTQEKQITDLERYNSQLADAQQKLDAANTALAQLESTAAGGGLQQLATLLGTITGTDLSNFTGSLEDLGSILANYINQQINEAVSKIGLLNGSVNAASPSIKKFGDNMRASGDAVAAFDDRVRDVNAFKHRIQYFFGLNNVINLFKRGVRQAFETIKDLDKAMTETAVVTDFTVSDMWKQLPEYTKRANELGVTTQQAYESATLFYQQGLNTQQAAALSTETLKMARIAGLDAAEATDRMTNALRGFNMELDAQSAQRVDDVYSQLAAHTASNVDEISTAMTKVASLAHSANMEFETTAAFLAQIIETTRESAETAGTALKTVVARFSEVKKLYSEDQLSGTDEEGQVIDVNKISAALRTAGIDLNQYFLGEVGLDDIFMELASKWDSLTSVQQRYIATQAAGSRQQSRFIALMQDYARTQELVGMAYDANGASAKQFEKTQDSLQSKLARLKNAWDEFLMGITNSEIVKGMVDALTMLLNVLNQITSAFGDGASSILKLVTAATALAGLKSLFKNGGIFDSILMNITGGNIFKAQVAEAGDIFISKITGATLTNTAGTGAAGIGGAGALAGIGSGLGIAAIVAAIIAALIAIEHFTDEGVAAVRKAKKAVEKQEDVVNESHELNKKQKDAYDSYIENQKIAQTTTDKNEKLAAEAAMQDAAQILQTIDVKNVIHTEAGLAIDETYVQQRQKELEKEEQYEQALLDFAEARQKYAENIRLDELTYNPEQVRWGDKAASDFLSGTVFGPLLNYMSGKANNENSVVGSWIRNNIPIYSTRPTGGSWWDYLVNPQYGKSKEELTQKINDQNAQNASTQRKNDIIYQQKISSGAEALLHQQGVEEKIAQTVADAYVQLVDQVEFSTKNSTQIEDELSSLAEIATSENGKLILDVINGSYENLISSSELKELYNTLPKEYKTTLQQLTNTNNRTILSFLTDQAKSLQKSQSTFRKNVVNNLSKAGVKNSVLLNDVQNKLSLTELKQLDDLRTSFSDYGEAFNDTILTSISDAMLKQDWDESALKIFTTKLSNNPVLTLQAITDEANNADSSLQGLAKDLLEITKKDSNFSTAGQLQYYFASDEYVNLASAIKEVSDESGNISADGVKKLAQQSKTLNALLKQGTMNANGLANALSLVAKGKLSFDQLTNSVLDALNHLYTFDSLVRDVHDFIANFDEGIDYGEGIDFLIDKTDELKGLLDNWEFGNQRSKNLYEMLFGTNYMDDWAKGDDYIKKRVTKMQNWLKNDGYNFFKDLSGSLGIKDKGKGKIDWDLSQFNDIEDLYTQVAKKAKISTDAAKMFIENFASHGDYKFNKQLNDLSQKGVINSIVDKYAKGKTLWRESDLQAIADSLGISLDKLKSKIQKAIDKAGLDGKAFEAPKTFKNGDLLKEFQQNLKLSDQNFSSFISDFVNNRQLDETHLRAALSSMGYAGDEMNALIQEIKDNLKETDQIDDVETNPEVKVDPEVAVAEDYSDKVTNGIVEATPKSVDVNVPVNVKPTVQDWDNFNIGDTSHDDATAKGMKILQALNEQRDNILAQVHAYQDSVASTTNDNLIDLANRPKVSAAAMANAGWDIGDNDYATLFSQDYASSTGKSILFTPIFTDENGNVNVLTPNALEQYAGEVLEGVHEDNLNLGIKAFDENTTQEEIDNYAQRIHELQAELYDDLPSLSDKDISTIDEGQLEQLITITPKIEDIDEKDIDIEPVEIETELNTDDIDPKAEAAAQTLYDKIYSGEVTAAEDGSVVVTTQLDEGVEASQVESLLAAKLAAGANDSGPSIRSAVTTAVEGGYYHIIVHADVEGLPTGAGALGGLVKSFAEGSADHFLQPGFALTGEEGPEIVWNKEKGYAYITGRNGAEFQNLQPGDRVFNAAETSRILRNSSFANGGMFQSFVNGTGRWKIGDDGNGGNKGGGGGGSKDSEDDKWKNEIDWLYNLVENIEELERRQTKLQEEYDDLLKDQSKTGKDLYKNVIKQMATLQVELDHQTYALSKREQEMREFMDKTNDMDDYLKYNWKDRTIEIDWDKIDKITDKEQYEHVKELIDQAEDIQSKMDDAEDAIIDINNQIEDLHNMWRETYKDFEDRVLEAIVKRYQDVIDEYSELNETLNNSNTAILEAINKEISLQRQIRDNTKTEEEIANNEAQLAYLRRDTTGGNDLAALQLQKELDDQRQNYEDTLVDQAVQRLQDDNDAAAEQREKQIEIMQAQLDYQSENGEFNAYMKELIESAVDPSTGALAKGSDLYELLTYADNVKAMTETGKEIWEEELHGTFSQVVGDLLTRQGGAEQTYFTAVSEAFNGLKEVYMKSNHGSYSQGSSYGSSGGGSSGSNNSGQGPGKKRDDGKKGDGNDGSGDLKIGNSVQQLKDYVNAVEAGNYGSVNDKDYKAAKSALNNASKNTVGFTYSNGTYNAVEVTKKKKHAKGGLNTTTGLAWLDGTLSEPEYVLNARQTEAFLKLADVLPAAMTGSGTTTNTTFGATTNNIVINVDKIDSDYSVDQMVDRVKEKLFESGSYRNANVLNFLR